MTLFNCNCSTTHLPQAIMSLVECGASIFSDSVFRVILSKAAALNTDYWSVREVGMGLWFGFTTATLCWSAVVTVSLLYVISSSKLSAAEELDSKLFHITLHSLIWPFCFGIGTSFTNSRVNSYYSASLSETCFYNSCRQLWQVVRSAPPTCTLLIYVMNFT
jgi:hypothetical protein